MAFNWVVNRSEESADDDLTAHMCSLILLHTLRNIIKTRGRPHCFLVGQSLKGEIVQIRKTYSTSTPIAM